MQHKKILEQDGYYKVHPTEKPKPAGLPHLSPSPPSSSSLSSSPSGTARLRIRRRLSLLV